MEQLDIDRIEADARSSGKANAGDVVRLTTEIRALRAKVEELEAAAAKSKPAKVIHKADD